MEENHQSPFLNVNEAGAFVLLKKCTLGIMRWMGTSPNFRKHGGHVHYHIDEDLTAVIRSSFNTSDHTYGARRAWKDVMAEGMFRGLHRVER
jgi:putative transposase